MAGALGAAVTVEYAMDAGIRRAEKLAETYGIDSQPVLDCLIRWGGIIEEIKEDDAPPE